MGDCVFCNIVSGKAPSHRVWEDEHYLAFLSIYPNTPGVTVVIPKVHYPSYAFDLPDDELARLTIATRQVALLLDERLDGVARTGMIFEGYGVDHVHAKLFPMHGIAEATKWRRIRSDVDKFFERYEGYLSSHDWKRADDDELAALAAHLRRG